MSVSGRWQGKLLDASGHTTRVVADLKVSGRQVAGEFSAYVESARDCCEGAGWKLAHVAPVSGSYASRQERLRLRYELKVGPKPIQVDFEAKVVKADPHAHRALVGSYSVSDAGMQIGFEGGACVLWLYGE